LSFHEELFYNITRDGNLQRVNPFNYRITAIEMAHGLKASISAISKSA